ncbi:metalloregulator ArsR/SmtB family transcription factor [Nocardioides sp. 1609]|uniref:ArsR/SmtB family transcription factor n=1 Tax=Nocardioides sp. 1609 TaxID=2508327 RepID=UPI00106FE3EB|nr:metalloregulator ArsR/SmtB family transcription factor [Nocardioides sp. 1609]
MDPFSAVSDPVRRELLRSLLAGPARVVDLAASRSISRPAVSRHLRLLVEAGLATVEDRGRERHYALAPDGLAPLQGLIDDLRPRVRLDEGVLDALDLEVRRTVRDHRAELADPPRARPDAPEETA